MAHAHTAEEPGQVSAAPVFVCSELCWTVPNGRPLSRAMARIRTPCFACLACKQFRFASPRAGLSVSRPVSNKPYAKLVGLRQQDCRVETVKYRFAAGDRPQFVQAFIRKHNEELPPEAHRLQNSMRRTKASLIYRKTYVQSSSCWAEHGKFHSRTIEGGIVTQARPQTPSRHIHVPSNVEFSPTCSRAAVSHRVCRECENVIMGRKASTSQPAVPPKKVDNRENPAWRKSAISTPISCLSGSFMH
jgi:hypothetical protein